jgi:hypothetical protein
VRRLTAGALLLVAVTARAEDKPAGLVARPLVGIGISVSDSGFGVGAQFGARLSAMLLRGTVDFGGEGRKSYALATLRGDWLYPISDATALLAGIGIGELAYGFIVDDPSANLRVLMPAVGVLLGHERRFGRLVAALTGLVPLGSVSHERDFAGQAIAPPHVMVTLLLSL